MSSFTIDKKEYMKAAGLVSGIAATKRDFWFYDFETRRNSTPEDYKRHFTEIFEMNALSVAEQYDDRAPYTDSNSYDKEFKQYKELGKQLVINGGNILQKAIHELLQFFQSALYQTETESYMYKMQMYLNNLIVALFKQTYTGELQSWGSLEIEEPACKYESIF